MRPFQISVVLPTFNEKENIGEMIERLNKMFSDYNYLGEIIVVDDKSPDGTAGIVREIGLEKKNVRVIVRDTREGVGAAHNTGYAAAEGDVIVSMDADLSHNPEDIPRLMAKLDEGYDFVVGSRYMEGGSTDKPLKNIIVSILGSRFISTVLKVRIHDFTNGFRAIRKDVFEAIFPEIRETGNAFLMETIYYAQKYGYRVTEVPTSFIERTRGESKTQVGKESRKTMIASLRLKFRRS